MGIYVGVGIYVVVGIYVGVGIYGNPHVLASGKDKAMQVSPVSTWRRAWGPRGGRYVFMCACIGIVTCVFMGMNGPYGHEWAIWA